MYPRLKQWYLWLRDTQQGPLRGTFQWQGRNATINTELNPKTLPSGIDDFPRASHPSINVSCFQTFNNLILFSGISCWPAFMAGSCGARNSLPCRVGSRREVHFGGGRGSATIRGFRFIEQASLVKGEETVLRFWLAFQVRLFGLNSNKWINLER
jgi:hypothetical protein